MTEIRRKPQHHPGVKLVAIACFAAGAWGLIVEGNLSAASRPRPTPTPTPTPTATPTATATFTPTPTATATATFTPTPTPLTIVVTAKTFSTNKVTITFQNN